MRKLSKIALAAAVLAALNGGAVAALSPTTPAPMLEYVAMGDSYSSGEGALDYDPAGGDCNRSRNAYPEHIARAYRDKIGTFGFVACTGAETADVLGKDDPEQDQLRYLSPATDIVTISVGGNDIGFAWLIGECLAAGVFKRACTWVIDRHVGWSLKHLPGRLDETFSAIHQKAPNARVLVVGYPHFYDVAGCKAGKGVNTKVHEKSQRDINAGIDTLNELTARRAAAHGFAFADPVPAFSGHEMCSGKPWLNAIEQRLPSSYHPTWDGHERGYFPTVDRYIRPWITELTS